MIVLADWYKVDNALSVFLQYFLRGLKLANIWEIKEIKDGICKLANSTYTMNMTIAEIDMHKIFDIDTVTRGRYSG